MMDNRTNKRKNYPGEDRFLVYILLLPPALYTLTVSVCVCVSGDVCVGGWGGGGGESGKTQRQRP